MFKKKDQELLSEAYNSVLNEGKSSEGYNLRVSLPSVKETLSSNGYRFYTVGGGHSKYFNNDRSMSIEIWDSEDTYMQNAYATIVRYSKDGQPIAFDGVIIAPKGASNLSQELGKGNAAKHGELVNARPWKTVKDIKALGYDIINPDTPEDLIYVIGKDKRQSQNRGQGPIKKYSDPFTGRPM
jgi:hypothetical protein